jgi:hypothetical protein
MGAYGSSDLLVPALSFSFISVMSGLVADVEDILQDTLSIFDDTRVDPDQAGRIRYGPLVLTVAPKVSSNFCFLASILGRRI